MELNSYSYSVEKKKEGSYLLKRRLMISAYVAYCVVFFLIIYITRIFPLGAVIPLTLYIIYLFTWKYVSVEYKYTVEAGGFALFRIYGGRKDKKLCELRIKGAKRIIPMSKFKDEIDAFSPKNVYDGRSSSTSDCAYAILFFENGVPSAVYIDAPEQSVKALHYYNPDNTVKSV